VACVKSKIPRFPREISSLHPLNPRLLYCVIALVFAAVLGPANGQSEPASEGEHEREELGVNRYTTPRIDRLFEQLDKLQPLPFDKLWRPLPTAGAAQREVKGLVFGGLVADGFLIVAGRKQNLVDELGRVLIREARGLGVGDSVTRHSASLSELGRAGKWQAVRKELSATQDDVEKAMIALRDEKLAALISLGGWIRGLEITSAAVQANYSPERAKTLQQPELVEYFSEELATLPPQVEHSPIFENLRKGVKAVRNAVGSGEEVLGPAQVEKLHAQAREMDLLLLQNQ
jgi:hypothetical protein